MNDISRNKITTEDITTNGVQSQLDQLQGTAAANKLVFDKLVTNTVKVRLNALIDDLMSVAAGLGATSIGSEPISGVTGTTVQAKLINLKAQIDGVTLGEIPALSLTNDKFALDAVPTSVIDGYTMPAFYAEIADTDTLLVAIGKLERFITDLAADDAIDTDNLADGAVTTDKLDADAVNGDKIADDAVDTEHLATGATIDNATNATNATNGVRNTDDSYQRLYKATNADTAVLNLGGNVISQKKILYSDAGGSEVVTGLTISVGDVLEIYTDLKSENIVRIYVNELTRTQIISRIEMIDTNAIVKNFSTPLTITATSVTIGAEYRLVQYTTAVTPTNGDAYLYTTAGTETQKKIYKIYKIIE